MNHVRAGRTVEYYSVKVVPLTACAPYPINSGIYSFFFFYCYWNTLSLEAFHMRICSFLWGGGINTGCMTMILLIPLSNITSEFHILKHTIWRWFCRWVLISITLCIIIFITPTSVFCFLTVTHNSVCPPSASTLSLLCSSQIIDTGKDFL